MSLKANAMSTIRIEIDEPLAALLHQTNQPVQAAAREMIVLELYRRGAISSGKAAELRRLAQPIAPLVLRANLGGRGASPRYGPLWMSCFDTASGWRRVS